MNGYQYILSKETEWAKNHGLMRIGSAGTHGQPAYTTRLEQNLFQPLLPEMQRSSGAAWLQTGGLCASHVYRPTVDMVAESPVSE